MSPTRFSSDFTRAVRQAKNLALVTLGCLAALGTLSLSRANRALAQGQGISSSALFNQLETQITTLKGQVHALQLQTKYITTGKDRNGYPATFIASCNVWVQDGSGSTMDNARALTGLGNLIIGYNEAGNPNGDFRSGSHNLILGTSNSYNSNSSLVVGSQNCATARFACVTGGANNVASGIYSSVTGGIKNSSSGDTSTVGGGVNNSASGLSSYCTGGFNNSASGIKSSVTGGAFNTAGGIDSSVSAGYSNMAIGTDSSISGGSTNTASQNYSSISGGYNNIVSDDHSTHMVGGSQPSKR